MARLRMLRRPRGFTIDRQKLDLELDLVRRSLRGKTEIYISPSTRDLKVVKLHCRQCDITRITVDDKLASNWEYQDPYAVMKPYANSTVHQHHLTKAKIEFQLTEPPQEQLSITLPATTRIRDNVDYTRSLALKPSTIANANVNAKIKEDPETPTSARPLLDDGPQYQSLKIYIEFEIAHIRDGLHFAGFEEGDARYPHIYTRNTGMAGTSCWLFPCLDEVQARYVWEISIKIPRTLGDTFHGIPKGPPKSDNVRPSTPEKLGVTEEEMALDLTVIGPGELTDEIVDPQDQSKKTVSFSCSMPVSAHQIGFVIGPFEDVNLSDLREIDEDDKLGGEAKRVHGFCLPGRAGEVRSTCMPLAKAIDFLTTTFTAFPFESYKICFVDDIASDTVDVAGLTICSTRLLYPEEILDEVDRVTRSLIFALARQWSGISIVAQEPSDAWMILGHGGFHGRQLLQEIDGQQRLSLPSKLTADRVFEMDMDRPSLFNLGPFLHLDPAEVEYVAMKASVVLFILDRRLTKSSGSAGLGRIIARLLRMSEDDGCLSTAQFQRQCEKMGHMKLETFFQQWVYDAGCPNFLVTQRFNKKKLVIEMIIRQTQADARPPDQGKQLKAETFLREVKEELADVYAEPLQPVFTGPMTIRIHEADGTPYEHIVDIKSSTTKFEIPYNTKYKRLKRGRKQKETLAVLASAEAQGDEQDDALVYCLGNVLLSEEEMAEWRLMEWPREEQERMDLESYEWIRMDADFEWICKLVINMPPYMFVSQLQQDRDVVAQMESIQYMAAQKEHPLISTFLTRTLMDQRYFHGIRTAAAAGLAKCAKDELDWIGQFHLEKVFRHFFCLPGSPMTRPNDFSDQRNYLIQCAIPRAISQIRDNSGQTPISVKRFFLDMLKFNDNSGNAYSDSGYVATLMSGLAETLATTEDHPMNRGFDYDDEEEEILLKEATNEIERYRRMDEWLPSFRNTFTVTALDCLQKLAVARKIKPNKIEILQYSQQGNADNVRLQALDCLIDLKGLHQDAILRYVIDLWSTDSSPYIRDQVFHKLGRGFGQIAVGEDKSLMQAPNPNGFVIEQDASTEGRAADLARKMTTDGAMAALKAEIGENEVLKEALWLAAQSGKISIYELGDILDFCSVLYDTETKLVLKFKYPRYWRCRHLGHGKLVFQRTEKLRLHPMKKREIAPPKLTIPMPPRPSYPTAVKPATPSLQIKMPAPARRPSMVATPIKEEPSTPKVEYGRLPAPKPPSQTSPAPLASSPSYGPIRPSPSPVSSAPAVKSRTIKLYFGSERSTPVYSNPARQTPFSPQPETPSTIKKRKSSTPQPVPADTPSTKKASNHPAFIIPPRSASTTSEANNSSKKRKSSESQIDTPPPLLKQSTGLKIRLGSFTKPKSDMSPPR